MVEVRTRQDTFFQQAGRISARDLESLIKNPDRYAVRDPDNPLLSRPSGTAVNGYESVSAEAYRIFDAYLAAWAAKADVGTLYGILLATKVRNGRMGDAGARIKALEYAVWDAKYRFEELVLRFIETANSNRFAVKTERTERWKRAIRKEVGNFFSSNRKRRGMNTHQASVQIRVESDLSQLGMFLTMAPLRSEFARPDVSEFILMDGKRRLKKYKAGKRREFDLYDQSMNNALESACAFALDAANFTTLVDAALGESDKRDITPPPP